MTWEDVANIYVDLLGLKIEWIATNEEYRKLSNHGGYPLVYDRGYDRAADNSKILKATGLTNDDFTPFKEGIKLELQKLGVEIKNC